MKLTEYDIKTFDNIEKYCKPDIWYVIKHDRPDRKELLESIQKFHECYGIIEFDDSDNPRKYRIVLPENKRDGFDKDVVKQKKKDDFYTKAYYPEVLTEQLKKDSSRPKLVVPGTDQFGESDIVKRIMDKERKDREDRFKKSIEEQNRIKKIQEWKKGV